MLKPERGEFQQEKTSSVSSPGFVSLQHESDGGSLRMFYLQVWSSTVIKCVLSKVKFIHKRNIQFKQFFLDYWCNLFCFYPVWEYKRKWNCRCLSSPQEQNQSISLMYLALTCVRFKSEFNLRAEGVNFLVVVILRFLLLSRCLFCSAVVFLKRFCSFGKMSVLLVTKTCSESSLTESSTGF